MTALRQSAPGETLAMLIGAYALFATAAWTSVSVREPLGIALSACGLWLATRSVGFRSGHVATPIITTCALALAAFVATVGLETVPNWLSSGLFSAHVLAATLAFAVAVDVVDFLHARGFAIGDVCRQMMLAVPWRSQRFWTVLLLALFGAYMIILPAAEMALVGITPPPSGARDIPEMTWGDHVRLRTVEAFTACMFLAVGANVGSFVNVVVYRAPLGLSVVVRSSRCPKCGEKIAARDNIPVIGWLKLGGRCRSCGLPISVRYPFVEGLTGSLFLLFYFVELLSGGINLPERRPNGYAGVVWIVFYTKWDLIGYYAYHMFLLTTLLTWALIRYDGHPVPRRLMIVAFATSAAAITGWPSLQLVAAGPTALPVGRVTLTDAWLTSTIGAAVGGALGIVITRVTTIGLIRPALRSSALPAGLALAGSVLGWQATCSIAVLTLVIAICVRRLPSRLHHRMVLPSLEASVFVATTIHQLCWSWIVVLLSRWWPARDLRLESIVTFLVIFSALSITLRLINAVSLLEERTGQVGTDLTI